MRTINYSAILEDSAGMAGMAVDKLEPDEIALFRTFHDCRLQTAWEIEEWPEICRTEKRTFRPYYDKATTYSEGDEVFDGVSGLYAQSLRDVNLGNPVTLADGSINAGYWAQSLTQYSGDDWKTGTAYLAGAIVRWPADGEYYCAQDNHTSSSSNNPGLGKFHTGGVIAIPNIAASAWSHLKTFDRYISYEQENQTAIGEFLRISDRDPRMTTKVVDLPYWLSENGAQLTQLQHAVSFVWVTFRLRRPTLSGADWDDSSVYDSGDQVYFTSTIGTGNFYVCLSDTVAGESPQDAPAKWAVVEIPYIFGPYLKQGGYTDWLRQDGQEDKAMINEESAHAALEFEADKLHRQQQQSRRLNFKR